MSVVAVSAPRLLTIAEYAALPEPASGYTELVEGRLLMTPSPTPAHNRASLRLAMQLSVQLDPADWEALQDLDVDLELSGTSDPGNARRPDVLIISRAGLDRVDRQGGILRASEVALVVEIVSPGSQRTDHIAKRQEYADAGIRHYWILELQPAMAMIELTLDPTSGHYSERRAEGVATTSVPMPLTVDLPALLG